MEKYGGLVNRVIGSLEVDLRGFMLEGIRQKAVAVANALPCVIGKVDVISLDYNYKLSLYNNYI